MKPMNVSRAFKLMLLPAITLLCACASNSPPHTAQAASVAANPQDVQQMLQEWKELKPGITRMLAIEDEMNQLLGQLGRLSNALDTSNQQQVAGSPVNQAAPVASGAPTITPVIETAPAIKPVASAPIISAPVAASKLVPNDRPTPENSATNSEQSSSATHFALQVASVTEKHKLPNIWQEMYSKNPQLLADMQPNFQQVYVNNNNYYRLKLGGFETQAAAAQKCRSLKAAGVFCLVVNYTQSDFAQLANRQLTANN